MLEVTSLVIANPNTHIRMQPDGLAWCSRSYARGIFLCGGTYAEVADPVGGCGTPRGGAALGGNRAHAAGSTDAASALVAPYLASAAPGVVPRRSRASHVPACNLFRFPVNSRHNFRNILSCDSLSDGTPHPKRMESKLPRPQACVSQVFLKTRCHGFCGQGSSKPFRCAIP